MIESRPDWVISRQRAWGVPIAVFVREKGDGSVEILQDEAVNKRIGDAFEEEGADAWYAAGARERFLGSLANEDWQKVDDILDVWFELRLDACLHAGRPAPFPVARRHQAQERRRRRHRDVSGRLRPASRLVSFLAAGKLRHARRCAVRRGADPRLRARRARPQDVEVARQHRRAAGRDQAIRRRHPAHVGLRVGLCRRSSASARRSSRPRSTPIASCATPSAGCSATSCISAPRTASRSEKMPELERLMLHRLAELDALVRQAYAEFDYKRIFAALNQFMTVDLSAFYFDIRKDALYCDPYSSVTRKAALTVIDQLFRCTVTWLAPMLCFTAEEAWLARYPRRGYLGASRSSSRRCRRTGATTRSPRSGARCAPCAASSPARWNSSAPASASARRSKRRPIVLCVRPGAVRGAGRRRPRRGLHHLGRDAGRRRGAGGSVPARRREGRRRRAEACRRQQVRALVEDLARRSAPIRITRT